MSAPKYLPIMILSYCVCILMANWFDPRMVQLGPLVTDAGTLIFPLSFLFSDVVTEVYGYKKARQAIWFGFLFNVVFLLYGQLIIHLPGPDYATWNHAFDAFLSLDKRVIIASLISYFIAEPINSWIMAKFKVYFNGRYMPLRFISSTLIASLLDSSIFSIVAFSYIVSAHDIFTLIKDMWLIKVSIEIIGLPLSLYLSKRLKKAEQIDIYDENTSFNLFSFNNNYEARDNHYR